METPRTLFRLANIRRRKPWTWTSQFCGFCLFFLGLFFHSILCISAGLIFIGFGFTVIDIPVPENIWFRFVRFCLRVELEWLDSRWTWKKRLKVFAIMLGFAFFTYALWTQDVLLLLLYLVFGVLCRVVVDNKSKGIKY